jgi:drug/metabolite transporter (DMT)-like permease
MKLTSSALGILLSALAYLLFTGFDTATKLAAQHYSVLLIMAVEFTCGTLFLLLWTWIEERKNFRNVIRFDKKHLHAARGLLNAASNICFFLGFTQMQLAEYYVILFLIPIWVAILASIFLHEKATPALVIAIVLSFIGVLIAQRPVDGLSPSALLVLCGTLSNAFGLIVLRRMTKTETRMSMAVSVCFFMALATIPLALFVFKMPDWPNFGLMALGGIFFATAQRFLIKSAQLAPVAIVGTAAFLQLVYGAVLGFLVFGDVPSLWIYVGGALVIAANMYLLYTQNKKTAF